MTGQQSNASSPKPLLKWAGGKRQLLPEILRRLPGGWNDYYEPFAGGAALLCSLYAEKRISGAVISDANPELFNFYITVRDRPGEVISSLLSLEYGNRREDYYSCRSRFNEMEGRESRAIERAVMFLYLNRHSYNGLWRVNSMGKYNVPFGKYSSTSYPAPDEILAFSRMLNSIVLQNSDFRESVAGAGEGDFVYFDPPYNPESGTANFTSYNSNGFSHKDQAELAELCRRLDGKGVRFMVSNSHTDTISQLYKDFRHETVPAARSINSVGRARKGARELIITNYDY